MLEALSLKSIYFAISSISFPIMLIALFVGWNSINTRCLLILLATVELIDTAIGNLAKHWGAYFYLWAFLYCGVYIYVVLARRLIVKEFKKYSQFCKDVYQNFYFSKQEGALILIYFLYAVVIFIALAELCLFNLNLIDSVPYLQYLFSPMLTLLCLFEAILILWLATRTVPVDDNVSILKINRKEGSKIKGHQESSKKK
ncbi:hypothetical protein L1077_10390 [Pseudoalteromonas luteoviolacea]|uniref:hypothetical protein n=1 Tax=Pseudoalteromonas luteoviolacea TaxID=43657 RepID=UPI001F2D6139|nr:hypothetical protein [Pseudoalteromonas luteoviolacea]MCF6439841.1 hypothetical protein [Pseudoalteromonas luteoviolacea]